MDTHIAFDAETGGTETNATLLALYVEALDDDLNTIDSLQLKLKPNGDEPYIVYAGALGVNKINLVEHDKIAVSMSEGGRLLREFLVKHSNNGKIKLIPVGHNVNFDEDFIWAWLLKKREYNKYVSYRRIDTGVLAQALKKKGKMPKSVPGSLTSLVEFYGLKFDSEGAHNEKADTRATVAVLRRMLEAI